MKNKMNQEDLIEEKYNHRIYLKITSAVFYGLSSFAIIVINKILLTTYRFPSYHTLGLGQMIATILILQLGRYVKIIDFPKFSFDIPQKIFPLPFFYLGNLICGLGGTKELSLPMFTALRRFTILMTLIGEYYILRKRQRISIVITIFAMVGGALLAASNDLAFDAEGYALVLGNDFFTAANGVYVKKKLNSKELGKYGLLFYNCIFMLLPISLLCWILGDFAKVYNYDYWIDPWFILAFISSCIMGFILMYSIVLCTSYNSALTTTIIGCLKNIFITYIGMYIGGDYVFSFLNFLGLNISMIGSLVYSYLTFIKSEPNLPNTMYKPLLKQPVVT